MPCLSVGHPRGGSRGTGRGSALRLAGEGAGSAHSTTRGPGPLAYWRAFAATTATNHAVIPAAAGTHLPEIAGDGPPLPRG